MRSLKAILLTGTAIMALVACSSDKGPGEIGSLNDIVIRNAGEKSALPPPGREPVKEVLIADSALSAEPADTTQPTAAEVIAAEDTGRADTSVVETAAAAQEAREKALAEAGNIEAAADATVTQVTDTGATLAADATATATAVVTPDTAPGVAWNQPRRIASPEEADKLVEEQMAQTAPPVATGVADAAPVVMQAQEATPSAPKIPVTATENYTQDPNAPYSPAVAESAQTQQHAQPPAPATPVVADTAATAPLSLARPEGAMPLDPAVLQSKDPATIRSLQKTLADAGFYKGALNGEMNSDTLNAYVKYQTAAQAVAAPTQQTAPVTPPVTTAPQPSAPQIDAPVQTQAQSAPEALVPPPASVSEYAAPSPRPSAVSRRAPEPLPAAVPTAETQTTPSLAPAPAATATPVSSLFPAGVSLNDPAVISAAQKALAAKGLYTGPATGAVDTTLLNAVIRYQTANGLTPGLLNLETLQSLGVVAK